MATGNLVGFVYNSRVPEAAEFVESLVDSLKLRQRCWLSPAPALEDKQTEMENTSQIIIVGGDGTILRAVRLIAQYDIPIVGINMGRVGFMTELTVKEASEKLPLYLDGGMRLEERMMLQATVVSDGETDPRIMLHALNDVVVGRGDIARLLDIESTANGVPLTSYRADAVIVSTATGSTGYAMSAGGPIIFPETRLMLIQPVAAHTGMQNGLVLPEDSVIELRANDGHNVMLSVDGFVDESFGVNDRVVITRSPHVVRFLRASPPSVFYTTLTQRLGLETHEMYHSAHD